MDDPAKTLSDRLDKLDATLQEIRHLLAGEARKQHDLALRVTRIEATCYAQHQRILGET